MKLIALATALALGGTAYAQTGTTGTTGTPGTTQTTPTQTSPTSGGTATQTTPTTGGSGQMTTGGYMPAQPPIAGTPPANATVRFQPSVSPSQAFPPPPPKDEYPICTRNQTDGCRQRGG